MNRIAGHLVPGLARVEAERDEARGEADYLRDELERRIARVTTLKARLRRQRRRVRARERLLSKLYAELAAYRGTGSPRGGPSHLVVLSCDDACSRPLRAALNAIPGFAIRSDTGAVLPHLHRFHSGLLAVADTPVDPTTLATLNGLVTRTVLRPSAGTRVTGFEERHCPTELMADYVRFIRGLFPAARVIVNAPEPTDASGELLHEHLFEVADQLGDDCFHLGADDYLRDPEALRPLFAWLGEDFDHVRVQPLPIGDRAAG